MFYDSLRHDCIYSILCFSSSFIWMNFWFRKTQMQKKTNLRGGHGQRKKLKTLTKSRIISLSFFPLEKGHSEKMTLCEKEMEMKRVEIKRNICWALRSETNLFSIMYFKWFFFSSFFHRVFVCIRITQTDSV